MVAPAAYVVPLVGVAVTDEVPRSTMTVFTLDQFIVAVRPVVEAATVHSVSWARPLAVLQRKNETANQALVDATVVSLRVSVIADCGGPVRARRSCRWCSRR